MPKIKGFVRTRSEGSEIYFEMIIDYEDLKVMTEDEIGEEVIRYLFNNDYVSVAWDVTEK